MQIPEYVYGNIAPVYTVFKEDESLDLEGQRNLFDFMLQTGDIAAFFVRSGMGQMYDYGFDDVKAMAKTACEHLAGKVPVLMNCSGIWNGNRDSPKRPDPEAYTRQAVELSRYAEGLGADGLVHVVPEALLSPGTEKDRDPVYLLYYETVCDSVEIPVFVYHPPVPHPISPELFAKLADIPNLVGVKISTTDGCYMFNCMRAVRGKEFHVVTGSELLYYATLPVGSRAVIGQGCNLYPKILSAMLHRYEGGDWDGVMEAQDSANLLVEKCPYSAGVMKRLATENGFPMGLTARNMGKTVYGKGGVPFDDRAYRDFKNLLQAELSKFE